MCVCGLNGQTAVQFSEDEDEDARFIVDVACRRGQELGSVLDERSLPFYLLLIMQEQTSWSCELLLPSCYTASRP